MGKVKLSKYQKGVMKHVDKKLFRKKKLSNLIVQACAGSGKSFTLWKVVDKLVEDYPKLNIRILAFNTEIANEGKAKLKELGYEDNVDVTTIHSFGLSLLKALFKEPPRIDQSKVWRYLNNKGLGKHLGHFAYTVNKIRDLGITETRPKHLKKLLKAEWEEFFALSSPQGAVMLNNLDVICKMLKELDHDFHHIDFNDMCRYPIVHDLVKHAPQMLPDVLLIDEIQDFNGYQIQMVMKMIEAKPDMKVIGVGDRWQAIYGFRGAIDSMDRLVELMDAAELPLSTTYRTRRKIVEWIKNYLGGADHLEAEKDGGEVFEVNGLESDQYAIKFLLKHGVNMVVSPKNKHLIRIAITLIDEDVDFTMRKAGVMEEVRQLIKRCDAKTIVKLRKKLGDVRRDAPTGMKGKELKDLVDTTVFFINHFAFTSVDEALKKITSIKRRDKGRGIQLHTGHSSKGLEGSCVAVIEDFFKMEGGQRKNLEYVAYTRAMDKLIVVEPFEKRK
ncbi:ATP-dependent DNA helicase [Vibrio phage vB_VcorM_GR11A]|nr:ATP-dependent DNA helicase [Vibrio phage vB_VcorM_GR11A]